MKKILLSLAAASLALSVSAQTVYFEEDFEWLSPWTESTGVHDFIADSDEIAAESKNLSNAVDDVTAYQALLNKGYTFVQATHPNGDTYKPRTADLVMYLQKNYLKMGLTGFHAGIVLPSIKNIPADAKLHISFDWAPMRQGNPGAEGRKYDPSELVVVIENGGNEEQVAVPPHTLQQGDAYSWMKADLDLSGKTVNENTKITIRQIDSQWPYLADKTKSAVCRYFLDNIKVYAEGGSGVAGIEAEENAPVEYYNLQGIRVANPENGLYIVKQGNKVTKRVIK